jgi:tol-pal system protein YbgF
MNMKNKMVIAISLAIISTSFAKAESKSIEQRIDRLERIADNPVLIQLSRKLGEQQSEIQQLYDTIDRLQHKINLMETKQNNRYKETDDRFSQLEASPTADAATGAQSNGEIIEPVVDAKLTAKPAVVEESTKSKIIQTRAATDLEKKEYKAAFSLMKAKKYQQASKAFLEFKQSYPESSLASNSLYWAGEANLVLAKQESALNYFMEVVNFYPDSLKAPGALLRGADTYRKLDNLDKAKEKYQLLIKNYPKSEVAERAKKRLKILGK